MPRRIQPLTAKRLDAVRPSDDEIVELGDGLLPGLRVRISRGGRYWSLNIRNLKGERRRFDVGDDLSLAEARRRAETLKQAIKRGADPTGERRDARRRVRDAKAGIGTFGSVINAYFDGDGASLRTMGEQRARIKHVFIKHLDRPATEITVQELQRAADAHPSASSASRAVTYLKPVARWAAKRGLMQRGFSELEKPMERSFEDGGHTVLDRDTLALVLPEFDQGHHGPAAKLMLWTAARLDEVCSATWNEFDLEYRLMDRRRGAAKGHTKPDEEEAGASPTSRYPFTPPSHFYAGEDARGKNPGGACISERPWRQTRQLGSLVEVHLQADGNERLDTPRSATDLRHAGSGTKCCAAHHKHHARPQDPRGQSPPRDLQ